MLTTYHPLSHVHGRHPLVFATAVFGALLLAMLSAPLAHAEPAASQHAPHIWSIAAGITTPEHAIEGMAFLPGTITIDAGDTVVWQAGSADIHTIVLPGAGGQIAPYDPGSYRPTSNISYDGSTFTASPVLTVLPATAGVPFTATAYALTFPKAGTYTYVCTVHQGMQGTIVVQPAGTAYPHTPAFYDQQARSMGRQIIAQGNQLYARARHMATDRLVIVGISNNMVGVMRFVRGTVTIVAGQSVTFTNLSMDPHTVTFGVEPSDPAAVAFPYGDPRHFDGSAPLNSGFMGLTAPASFTVTFTKTGTYQYRCALHDYMGMVGTIIVLPANGD